MTLKTAIKIVIIGLIIGILLGIPQFISSGVRLIKIIRFLPGMDFFTLAEIIRFPSVFITQIFLLIFFIYFYKAQVNPSKEKKGQ
jgi:hypothetical protein